MNLSSSIDSILLQNKFLNLVVVLWFWDFCRPRDQMGSGCSGIHGEFGRISGGSLYAFSGKCAENRNFTRITKFKLHRN